MIIFETQNSELIISFVCKQRHLKMHRSLVSALGIPEDEAHRSLTKTDSLLLLSMETERWASLTTATILRVIRVADLSPERARDVLDIRTSWILWQISLRQVKEQLLSLREEKAATENELVAKRLELLPVFNNEYPAVRQRQTFFIDAIEDRLARLNARIQLLQDRYAIGFPIKNGFAEIDRQVSPHLCIPSRQATAPKYHEVEHPFVVGPTLKHETHSVCCCAFEPGVDIELDLFPTYPSPDEIFPQPF